MDEYIEKVKKFKEEKGITSIMTAHKCPVCGEFEFLWYGSLDTCEVCGWVDDMIQEVDPDEAGCANVCSLNWAREQYKKTGKAHL